MGTSISQDKDKASPIFCPDETDNPLKNENTSCFVEQSNADNDSSNIYCDDKNYNYAAIDLNLSNQEKLNLKTNSKMRKTIINDFINKYDLHYEERKNIIEQKTAEQKNNQTIRSNIRILIIVASNPDCYSLQLLDETGDFFENAEDFTTAFLICHLFHYAFLIPYSQILITSTEEKSFTNTKTFNKFNFNQIEDDDDFYYDFSVNKFGFQQNVNYAQIGKIQYKFSLEDSMMERIKPFHHKIIKKELLLDENSEIFLFLLNHCISDFLTSFDYRFFIDELIQIPSNHFYVMNDSYCSGSLIEMIKISNKFEVIFADNLKFESEYFLVKFLFTFGLVELNEFKETLVDHIDVIDSFSIDNASIKDIKDFIINMDQNTTQNMYNFLHDVLQKFPGISTFTPRNFYNFGRKSIIFTSSDYQNVSLTLPARKIQSLLSINYRICGSIFSSIFIESLLTANSSFEVFCNSIKQKLLNYKDEFQQIIIDQNTDILGSYSRRRTFSKEIIQSFFHSDLLDDLHCYNKLNNWPDLNSILIKDQFFWNVDTSIVDKFEYNKVFICTLGKKSICKNVNDFGPAEGESFVEKFAFDFEVAVNQELKDTNFGDIEFSTYQPTDLKKKALYEELEYLKWAKFMIAIRSYINSKIFNGIMALKYPILKFFYDNPNFDVDTGISLFVNAFKNINPFWNECSILY